MFTIILFILRTPFKDKGQPGGLMNQSNRVSGDYDDDDDEEEGGMAMKQLNLQQMMS